MSHVISDCCGVGRARDYSIRSRERTPSRMVPRRASRWIRGAMQQPLGAMPLTAHELEDFTEGKSTHVIKSAFHAAFAEDDLRADAVSVFCHESVASRQSKGCGCGYTR